jgi:hypothetical protein
MLDLPTENRFQCQSRCAIATCGAKGISGQEIMRVHGIHKPGALAKVEDSVKEFWDS